MKPQFLATVLTCLLLASEEARTQCSSCREGRCLYSCTGARQWPERSRAYEEDVPIVERDCRGGRCRTYLYDYDALEQADRIGYEEFLRYRYGRDGSLRTEWARSLPYDEYGPAARSISAPQVNLYFQNAETTSESGEPCSRCGESRRRLRRR